MFTTFTTHGIQQLTLMVNVGKITRKVVFTVPCVYGNMGKACFTTGDADLIKAMKADPKFGVFYFVKEEVLDAPEETISEPITKTIEDELRDPATAVYDETVTTKGMAVAYIQGNYDDVFTTSTVEDMKREAARKWNVIFKNWGK